MLFLIFQAFPPCCRSTLGCWGRHCAIWSGEMTQGGGNFKIKLQERLEKCCLVIQHIQSHRGFNPFVSTGFLHFSVPSSEQQIQESVSFLIHHCAPGLQFSWNIPPNLIALVVVYLSISPYKKWIAIPKGPLLPCPYSVSCFAEGNEAHLQSNLGVMLWASYLGQPTWGRLRESQACNWGERQPAEPRQLSAWMQAARDLGWGKLLGHEELG